MGFKTNRNRFFFTGSCLLFFIAVSVSAQTLKLKVIVDGARVNATPSIEGRTLAQLSLDTLMEASSKRGEWFPVSLQYEGVEINGFIHEMLVSVISEDEWKKSEADFSGAVEKSQKEIVNEIESGIEYGRDLIRQEKDLERALYTLRSLVAKAFRVSDLHRQRQLAAEIFLWLGLGYAAQENIDACMEEFGNMYVADRLHARGITQNIFDPEIIALIQHADKTSRGEKPEYVLQISTRPADAVVLIDGKEEGISPGEFVTQHPMVKIEIRMPRYKPVQETLMLSMDRTEKIYDLEVISRDIALRSTPTDAQVFLDGEKIEEMTNCILPMVPFGEHQIRLVKRNFLTWEENFELGEGVGPHYIEALLLGKNYKLQNKWGGLYSKMFESPVGIALDENQYIYVLDSSNTKVKKFTPQGDLIKDWKLQEKEAAEDIRVPYGIAVDSQGFIYISDARRHCIWKFYPDGKISRKWGREGSRDGEFKKPGGIAIDSQNNLYVIDAENMRVCVFSPLGVVKEIMYNPSGIVPMVGIAINSLDEIFILDNFHVQKYSSQGERLDAWGEAGTGEGQFNNPQGIYVDKDRFVYIADTGNKRVQKYDEAGNFIVHWESPELNFPLDIVVSSKGEVLVVDRDANSLMAYGISP